MFDVRCSMFPPMIAMESATSRCPLSAFAICHVPSAIFYWLSAYWLLSIGYQPAATSGRKNPVRGAMFIATPLTCDHCSLPSAAGRAGRPALHRLGEGGGRGGDFRLRTLELWIRANLKL